MNYTEVIYTQTTNRQGDCGIEPGYESSWKLKCFLARLDLPLADVP